MCAITASRQERGLACLSAKAIHRNIVIAALVVRKQIIGGDNFLPGGERGTVGRRSGVWQMNRARRLPAKGREKPQQRPVLRGEKRWYRRGSVSPAMGWEGGRSWGDVRGELFVQPR